MPTSTTNPKHPKKLRNAKKPWKGAPSKPSETTANKKRRASKILSLLKRYYPEAKCSLEHETPLQLLIATILSAQCTDARVNKVTPSLFAKYQTVSDFANADLSELEEVIRSTGFYRNKAKNIKGCCQKLLIKFGGEIPKEIENLSNLPGVGRKTANVVLGNVFGIPGMVVDTHVGRLSRRMALTVNEDPVKVEHDLMEIIPKEDWTLTSHLLIDHGRAVCDARNPKCESCFLKVEKLCPQIGVEDGHSQSRSNGKSRSAKNRKGTRSK